MRRAFSDVAVTVAVQGASVAFGVINSLVVARSLGPLGRGELVAIQLIPTLLTSLAGLGMWHALIYYTAEEPEEAGRLLGTALTTCLVISLPLMAVGLGIQELTLAEFRPEVRTAASWFLLYVPLNLINALPWSTLQGLRRMWWWNVVRIQPACVYTIAVIVAWTSGINDAISISMMYLGGILVICIPSTWIVYRKVVRSRLEFDRSMIRKTRGYAGTSLIGQVPVVLNQRLDQLVMAALLSPRDLGLYAAAVSWSGLTSFLFTAIGSNVLPRIASSEQTDRPRLLRRVMKWSAASATGVVVVLAVITPVALPLALGEDFRPAIGPALVLIIAAWFSSISQVTGDAMRGAGQPKLPSIAEFLALGATVVGVATLVKPYGLWGAAVTSLGSYSMATALLCLAALRRFPITAKPEFEGIEPTPASSSSQ